MIAGYQLMGLLAAAFTQSLLVFAGFAFARAHWVFAYLILILALSSILTLQGLIAVAFLPWLCLFFLVIFAAKGVRAATQAREKDINDGGTIAKLAGGIALFFLIIDGLFAALPVYRYDQWNYHLIIPKIIDNLGTLPRLILSDTNYFSSSYEFFFTIIRKFWDNDIFNQSYANAFSWFSVVVPVFGLCSVWRRELGLRRWNPFLLTGFFLFAMSAHEAVVNAKPDYFHVGFALACLTVVLLYQRSDSPKWGLLVGFFFVAPLSFKVSWLHFAAALFVACALTSSRKLLKAPRLYFGASLGFLCALPFFLKNGFYFGNPFHPIQFGPLKSQRWTEQMAAFWDTVSMKPRGMGGFFAELSSVPWDVVTRLGNYVVVIAAFVAVSRWKKMERLPFDAGWKLFGVALACYYLFWPLFYSMQIDSRFVAAIFGLAAFGVLLTLRAFPRAAGTPMAFLLLIAFLSSSNIEVKLKKLARGMFVSSEDFYAGFPPHLQDYLQFKVINAHRAQRFAKPRMDEHVVLSDDPPAYFLNSLLVSYAGHDFPIYVDEIGRERVERCPWLIFKKLDISYVIVKNRSIIQWPVSIVTRMPEMERISLSYPIYFVSPEFIEGKLKTAECR